ncbi:hypothetical protein HOY82DRAFT_228937 [Tuber indicum]|nr:hypothetical protein HOY82DRAFT_228937 [Tuber indicum]
MRKRVVFTISLSITWHCIPQPVRWHYCYRGRQTFLRESDKHWVKGKPPPIRGNRIAQIGSPTIGQCYKTDPGSLGH